MELQTKLKMMLPVPLSQMRKVEIGTRMSEVELIINSKEESKKAIAAEFSEEIKKLEAELYALAKQFQENAVNEETECRVDFNVPGKNQKTIIRLDTNQIVNVYDMSESERLAFEEPDLFDPQNTNFPLRIFATYGIEVDRIFQPEEYAENIFIVKSNEDLAAHEIAIDSMDEETQKELINCLVIRCDEAKVMSINENIQHVFRAESAESEDLIWFFFKELNQTVTEEEKIQENITVIEFNPETMDKEEIVESYSGDRLTENKIRSHFEIDGKKYVNVGGTESQVDAYELVPHEEYTGETHEYGTSSANYEGQLIIYRKKEYVLANPIQILFRENPEEKELEEYKVPENKE